MPVWTKTKNKTNTETKTKAVASFFNESALNNSPAISNPIKASNISVDNECFFIHSTSHHCISINIRLPSKIKLKSSDTKGLYGTGAKNFNYHYVGSPLQKIFKNCSSNYLYYTSKSLCYYIFRRANFHAKLN